jgi:hypothetical protein
MTRPTILTKFARADEHATCPCPLCQGELAKAVQPRDEELIDPDLWGLGVAA